MTDKILVEVFVPVANTSWDVWIPSGLALGEVSELVAGMLDGLSNGVYRLNEGLVLCDYETGLIFDADKSVERLGLRNGSRLLLA